MYSYLRVTTLAESMQAAEVFENETAQWQENISPRDMGPRPIKKTNKTSLPFRPHNRIDQGVGGSSVIAGVTNL